MKLTCFYTPQFEPMLIRFLSGIADPVALACFELPGGEVGGLGGGKAVWRFKTELLIREASPRRGEETEICLFTDIDIAVYGEMAGAIGRALETCHMVFQRERNDAADDANIGVIAFRRSPAVLRFWGDVLALVEEQSLWDQGAVNRLIHDAAYLDGLGLRVGFLPGSFWARSQLDNGVPAEHCILHHANCVESLADKWAQLNHFKPIFSRARRLPELALVKAQLPRVEWIFGELGAASPHGTLRFDGDLVVQGHPRAAARRLLARPDCLLLQGDTGAVTTVFNEFYIDLHRNRVAVVGPAMNGHPLHAGPPPKFNYLMGSFFN